MTAEQVTHLIERCQDTLDEEFMNLYRTQRVIKKLLEIKFKDGVDQKSCDLDDLEEVSDSLEHPSKVSRYTE